MGDKPSLFWETVWPQQTRVRTLYKTTLSCHQQRQTCVRCFFFYPKKLKSSLHLLLKKRYLHCYMPTALFIWRLNWGWEEIFNQELRLMAKDMWTFPSSVHFNWLQITMSVDFIVNDLSSRDDNEHCRRCTIRTGVICFERDKNPFVPCVNSNNSVSQEIRAVWKVCKDKSHQLYLCLMTAWTIEKESIRWGSFV